MSTVTRARSLDCNVDALCLRGIAERDDVLLPGFLVEIRSEEPACLVRQHGINPSGEIGRISGRFPGQMGANNVVTERDECLIWALTALDLRFSADPSDPLIPTCRRIARLPAFRILPSAREYLLPPSEQAPEERDLTCGW